MSFFMYHLSHDHWGTPWTFIVLATVSLLTTACLVLTIMLHCFRGLSPTFNLTLNSCLSLLWALGFSMLSYFAWATTLTHSCSLEHWDTGLGVTVCRIYKAVYSFSLIGFISTLAALFLDLHILNLSRQRGQHHRIDYDDNNNNNNAAANNGLVVDYTDGAFDLDLDDKPYSLRKGWRTQTSSGAYQQQHSRGISSLDLNDDDEGLDVVPLHSGADGTGAKQRQWGGGIGAGGVGSTGYKVPSGQFDEDDEDDDDERQRRGWADTSYHGAAASSSTRLRGGL
ncbi:hypothetical protein AAFC00_004180 [Neodothiora populina]|uniref:MARVEL domain-containing protein n=1 Tax=Neodothiora populina TaxID=2781224 RepID=A0ABR3PIV4_9PEZI